MKFPFSALLAILWICFLASTLHAQDMEPRAYSISPVGTNFLLGGFAHSSGEVSLDPSIPITDVNAKIDTALVGYSRSFALAGRSANGSILLPYLDANITGNVGDDAREVNRSGVGDLRLRFAVNLLGGPALTPEEFAKRVPETALGVSASVVAPTGEYNSTHLINIGANRWAFKPDIGITQPIGDFFVEGSAGVWLYTDNNDFYGGMERKQDPIGSFQLHTGYNFRPGLWLAFNANYWEGGQTTVDGDKKDDQQSSSRYGVTLTVPISAGFSAKVAWSNGLTTRVGGNFDTLLAVLQYRWLDTP